VTDKILPAHQIQALRFRVPLPADPTWVEEQIRATAEAGFNTLVLEVFSRGFTCFPFASAPDFGLPRLHAAYRKRDILEVACVLAQEHGLRIIAGLECLNVGSLADHPPSPLGARRYNSWRVAGQPRTFYQHPPCDSPDLLFCPANPDVRDLASTIAAEVADAYPVDGIMLSGLQFGPAEGQSVGRCFCLHCTHREGSQSKDADEGAAWDAYRLKQITHYLTCVKARARQGRRNLRIWGELPVLPGCCCPTELLSEEFDHELMDVCVVPLDPNEILLCTPPAAGVEVCHFRAQSEEEINKKAAEAPGRSPLGYVCRWNSHAILQPARVHIQRSGATVPADAEPASAARYWLELAAREGDGVAGKHARECLALWDTSLVGGPPLDQLHAMIASALPEDNAQPDEQLALIERAFALLRLAIMIREDAGAAATY
jgi:hypothetical protein